MRSRRAALLPFFSTFSVAGVLLGGAAEAAGDVVAKGRGGLPSIAVRVEAGHIVAKRCAAEAGCSAAGGKAFRVPAEIAPRLAGARVEAVELASGKQVVLVEVPPSGSDARGYAAILAAPNQGGNAPRLVFDGPVVPAGSSGVAGRVGVLQREKAGRGERLVVGQYYPGASLCGRPAIFAGKEVDPNSLELVGRASAQSLPARERGSARKVKLEAVPEGREAPRARLLRAKLASSAVDKRFHTLTDGDLSTFWSEAKRGEGRGEFVVADASTDAPIRSFEIVFRPGGAGKEEAGAAYPRRLYLVADAAVFEVSVPEDATRRPGQRYEVKLPEPLRAACVAAVLDDAHASGREDPAVSLAELTARTELDTLGEAELAAALSDPARAPAAAALLGRSEVGAVSAIAAAWERLPSEARPRALDVVDAAPCAQKGSFFASLLGRMGPKDPDRRRVLDRLRRCGAAAAPGLAELVRKGEDPAKVAAANELALLAPKAALPAILAVLPGAKDEVRRDLRSALSLALKRNRADGALAEILEPGAFAGLREVVRIDLLRALGPRIAVVPGGREAFAFLLERTSGAPSLRRRYLLQGPAAELARAGDARALAFLRASLRADPDPHVRAKAAAAAARVPSLVPQLVEASGDPAVRVREAALLSLSARDPGRPVPPGAPSALAARLESDPWTFVRVAAARGLAGMPAGPASDTPLAAALGDASPLVRIAAVEGLGAHRARAHAEAVAELSENASEFVDVRTSAILALGQMCDASQVDAWTRRAKRAAAPLDEAERKLGAASITALGMVRPKDLEKRLAPLLGKEVPRDVREVARLALAADGACR